MQTTYQALLGIALLVALAFWTTVQPAMADGLSGLTPAEEYRGSFGRYSGMSTMLAPYKTQKEMIRFVGAHPARCEKVPRGAKICVWRLSKQENGWRPLAALLDTGDRLNLVCEFSANSGPRAKDSCSVHSQRSNRRYYRNQLNMGSGGRREPKSTKIRKRTVLRAQAEQMLAEKRTALELSTLVGDAPSQCRSGDGQILCTWKATADTYGHGTLAIGIGADFSKKVRMTCMLPADGTPRAPDSCTVQIGD